MAPPQASVLGGDGALEELQHGGQPAPAPLLDGRHAGQTTTSLHFKLRGDKRVKKKKVGAVRLFVKK